MSQRRPTLLVFFGAVLIGLACTCGPLSNASLTAKPPSSTGSPSSSASDNSSTSDNSSFPPVTPDPLSIHVTLDPEHAASNGLLASAGMAYNFSAFGKTADNTEFHLDMLSPLFSQDADGTLLPAFGSVVTVTPVSAIEGLPFSKGYLAAVQITPEGLLMIEPASLKLTLPADYDLSTLMGFAADGDGGDFHLFPILVGSSGFTGGATDVWFDVMHFSLYGVAQVTQQEIEAQAKHPPKNPASQEDQDLAPLVIQEDLGSLNVIPPEIQKKVEKQRKIIENAHNKNVMTGDKNKSGQAVGMNNLSTINCTEVTYVAVNFEYWKARVETTHQTGNFQNQIETDAAALLERLEDCLKVPCLDCVTNPSGKKVPSEKSRDFIVMAELAQSMATILGKDDVANMWRELENRCADHAGLPPPWPHVADCGINCPTPLPEAKCP